MTTERGKDLGRAGANSGVYGCLGGRGWGLSLASPAALYPFCQLAESVGGTTAVNPNVISEDVNGASVLEPGAGYTPEGIAAAGSSPLVFVGIVWEEEALAS